MIKKVKSLIFKYRLELKKQNYLKTKNKVKKARIIKQNKKTRRKYKINFYNTNLI